MSVAKGATSGYSAGGRDISEEGCRGAAVKGGEATVDSSTTTGGALAH